MRGEAGRPFSEVNGQPPFHLHPPFYPSARLGPKASKLLSIRYSVTELLEHLLSENFPLGRVCEELVPTN